MAPLPATSVRILAPEEVWFCAEYVVDFNATAAAKRAKLPSPNLAHNRLKDPAIQGEVNRIANGLMRRSDLKAEDVVNELSNLAFSNLDDFMSIGSDGYPRWDFAKVTRSQMAAVSEITVDEYVEGQGEAARPVKRVKVKLHDKRASLVDLGRYFGVFKQPDMNFNVAIVLSPDELNA
jgi:phage terminase small subunit